MDAGILSGQAERLARQLGFPEEFISQAAQQMQRLYRLFVASDSLQVEVNPLALTKKGQVMAIDAKVQLDENAAFRQNKIFAARDDLAEQDPREAEASKSLLNYIGLDGSIGCLGRRLSCWFSLLACSLAH